jgi:ABC-type transporter Mla MlaB component
MSGMCRRKWRIKIMRRLPKIEFFMSEDSEMTAIILPAIVDKASLLPLAREMMEQCDKGEPVVVDGSKVGRIGLAGLQLLVSGALAARDKSVAFEVNEASDELIGAASMSGLCDMFGISAEGASRHD